MSGKPRHGPRPGTAERPGEGPHCPPPSAAGHLEPYGVRVRLQPRARPLETAPFLKALLEGIASSSAEAGATLIGHLKCALQTDSGPLFGNLTSVRSGATCRGDGAQIIVPGGDAQLDLAVLIYGLSAEVIDGISWASP